MMKEHIHTIPVNEAFEAKDGCPLCRLYHDLEQSAVERIVGPAMMEPDVRIETNKHGFCKKHLGMMKEQNAILPLALMLDTYVDELYKKSLFKITVKESHKSLNAKAIDLKKLNDDCYVCSKIEGFFNDEMDTVFRLYKKEADFRKVLSEQEYFCLPHLEKLLALAPHKLFGKDAAEFAMVVTGVTNRYLQMLEGDLNWFCRKFDYGNKDKDWGNSRDSVERAIAVLSGK